MANVSFFNCKNMYLPQEYGITQSLQRMLELRGKVLYYLSGA
jgi:hypothetical protein